MPKWRRLCGRVGRCCRSHFPGKTSAAAGGLAQGNGCCRMGVSTAFIVQRLRAGGLEGSWGDEAAGAMPWGRTRPWKTLPDSWFSSLLLPRDAPAISPGHPFNTPWLHQPKDFLTPHPHPPCHPFLPAFTSSTAKPEEHQPLYSNNFGIGTQGNSDAKHFSFDFFLCVPQ